MSKAGLTRKKITVRRGGKSFQRSVMVRAEAIGKRASGKKLNSLNPWETRHIEHVSISTALGRKQEAYGSSGPGSDHSWLALIAQQQKQRRLTAWDSDHPEHGSYTSYHAGSRRAAGAESTMDAPRRRDTADALNRLFTQNPLGDMQREEMRAHWGSTNIRQVQQNPRKHVRT